MRSMTGFGRGCAMAENAGVAIHVEIHSVNRKTLDVQINAPREWSGYEAVCHKWMRGAFQRGRVHIQIKAEGAQNDDSLTPNTQAMNEGLQQLKAFAQAQDIDFKPDSNFLLRLAETVKNSKNLPDWRDLKDSLHQAFQAALVDIDAMRSQEGHTLAEDLKARITELDNLRQQIEQNASDSPQRYRDTLLKRLKQLELELDLSDERVLKEVALFADRSDISEENTRLACHFEQFLSFLEAEEATGRKMDFLCQEIHRELNTTGSKSNDIEVTRLVIESKNALERIREQVQNIE